VRVWVVVALVDGVPDGDDDRVLVTDIVGEFDALTDAEMVRVPVALMETVPVMLGVTEAEMLVEAVIETVLLIVGDVLLVNDLDSERDFVTDLVTDTLAVVESE
jgi:hypothetical protein